MNEESTEETNSTDPYEPDTSTEVTQKTSHTTLYIIIAIGFSAILLLLAFFIFSPFSNNDKTKFSKTDSECGNQICELGEKKICKRDCLTEDNDSLPDNDGLADQPNFDLVTYTEEREQCEDQNVHRNLYFGDFHVHTNLSMDAHHVWGLDLTPSDAYEMGKSIDLDFAAVTDHAEWLGEAQLCDDPNSPSYKTEPCQRMRQGNRDDFTPQNKTPDPKRNAEVCGVDGSLCEQEAKEAWEIMQAAAEEHYDRSSACNFSTFVGYEWTSSHGYKHPSNVHRNAIFRNDDVIETPLSHFEAVYPVDLWEQLDDQCNNDPNSDCEVITIPHNLNFGGGEIFSLDFYKDAENEKEVAQLRAKLEPVVEMFQHKGHSECIPDSATGHDPLCDWEIDLSPGFADQTKAPEDDFMRGFLLKGLTELLRIGVNPYESGVIASTDTHSATPGFVNEDNWNGHVADVDDDPIGRLRGQIASWNPGGLAAVWAVENSRDAIFEAFKRKEVYSVSGPKIQLRFFGSWNYDDSLHNTDYLDTAYAAGVPMGSVLKTNSGEAPKFLIHAVADGTPLQHMQVIKGWIDRSGHEQAKIFEVAGGKDNGASVDLNTCQTSGPGSQELKTTWTDPEFDPDVPAFYYVRVLENPTCRWSTRECNALPEQQRSRLFGCTSPDIDKSIQERAWSSPIWYSPETN